MIKDKSRWKESIPYVSSLLTHESVKIQAKVLWLLGEMGLEYPHEAEDKVPAVASFCDSSEPLLRERTVNALGRIGRGNYPAIEPFWKDLFRFADDEEPNETKPGGTVVTRFTPIAPYDTPDAVENLCNAYESAIANEKIDSLILIPTFICDFLCIHPFNDGNGRMSRLLTLLLLYKNGYSVGKYISIEKQIEKTKDRYYDTLEESDAGWHEEENDPTPFIRYMLQTILACYTEFEERVGLMNESGNGSTAYDIVRKYTEEKIGKFTGADVVAHCPSIGRSSALAALKKLTEQGLIIREGAGRSTFYVRADSK